MRKESKLFFSFPRRSNFGEAKVTKILSKREEKKTVSFLEREEFIKKYHHVKRIGLTIAIIIYILGKKMLLVFDIGKTNPYAQESIFTLG